MSGDMKETLVGSGANDLRAAEAAVCGAADDYLTAWGDQTNLDVSSRMQYLFKRVREWRLAKSEAERLPPVAEKVAEQLAQIAYLSQRMSVALSDVLATLGELIGEGIEEPEKKNTGGVPTVAPKGADCEGT